MSEEVYKEYTNGEITVVWQSQKCIHSKICWQGLRNVFDPFKRPWIDMTGDDTAHIKAQVDKCPSGALNYYENH